MHRLVALVLGAGGGGGELGQLEVGERGLDLGARLVEARARVGRVQARDHLAGGHVLPLFDQHLGHPAGHLAGDGGLAAGDHIAGGVEQGRALRRSRRRRRGLGGGDAHGHAPGLHNHEEGDEGDDDDRRQHAADDPPHACGRPSARTRTGLAIDLQLPDQRGLVHASSPPPSSSRAEPRERGWPTPPSSPGTSARATPGGSTADEQLFTRPI